MSLSSNAVSKRMKTEANLNVINNSSTATASKLTVSEDAAEGTFIDVFTEDILPEIFDNLEILTAQDLLNFRLVNRCWRDSATSVLLNRNLCQIFLTLGKVEIIEDGKAVSVGVGVGDECLMFHRKEGFCQTDITVCESKRLLSSLSQLFSTSVKFPSKCIRFSGDCSNGFKNLCPTSDSNKEDEYKKDVFHFLSLYGKKINQLRLCDEISKKALQNLLYVHMPHLTILDLTFFREFSSQAETFEGSTSTTNQVCLPPPSHGGLDIKEILIEKHYQTERAETMFNLIKELINVSPNMSAIRNVDFSIFCALLEIGKSHFAKDLNFDSRCRCNQMSAIPKLFTKLLTDMIMKVETLPRHILSKIIFVFGSSYSEHGNGNHNRTSDDSVVTGINLILSANKNSLKHFFDFKNIVNIFIPPLPNLELLVLGGHTDSRRGRLHFLGDVIGQCVENSGGAVAAAVHNLDSLLLQNQAEEGTNINNIPENYFPRLRNVNLRIPTHKLSNFFSLQHLGPDKVTIIPGDTLLTVTTLELSSFPRWYGMGMSQLFPNVSHLKIQCEHFCFYQNWVWTFPKLERFEMCGLKKGWETNAVNIFFTGIPITYVSSLFGENLNCVEFRPPKVLQRTMPYIGDCENLKELRIAFSYPERNYGSFGSKLTATHGFKDVATRTKIIFSVSNKSQLEEMRQNLDHVSAYIEIEIRTM